MVFPEIEIDENSPSDDDRAAEAFLRNYSGPEGIVLFLDHTLN